MTLQTQRTSPGSLTSGGLVSTFLYGEGSTTTEDQSMLISAW